MSIRLAFYEVFAEEEAELRRQLADLSTQASFCPLTIQESGDPAPTQALISIRTQSRLPAAWWPGTRALLTRSTGYDHLLPLAGQPGAPPLAALPEYCSRAVAEQAVLLWMALLRRLPAQVRQMARFDRERLTGRECAGAQLALFGVGRIGHEIAGLARALGMQVVGVDPVQRHADVPYLPPDRALAAADVVVCAMNLTTANRGYFDAARWGQVQRGAAFVNVARGELSPPGPLLEALRSGRLAGAALDVYDGEDALGAALRAAGPAAAPSPWPALLSHPAVLCTPHNAFNTAEAVVRKCAFTVAQCRAFIESGVFRWPLAVPPPGP